MDQWHVVVFAAVLLAYVKYIIESFKTSAGCQLSPGLSHNICLLLHATDCEPEVKCWKIDVLLCYVVTHSKVFERSRRKGQDSLINSQ